MQKAIAVLCFVLASASVAFAQDKAKDMEKKAAPAVEKSAKDKKEPSEKQKAQQEKMKSCNKQAGDKNLKGDARKEFMSACLKG